MNLIQFTRKQDVYTPVLTPSHQTFNNAKELAHNLVARQIWTSYLKLFRRQHGSSKSGAQIAGF